MLNLHESPWECVRQPFNAECKFLLLKLKLKAHSFDDDDDDDDDDN
jgi:hypothetical protein